MIQIQQILGLPVILTSGKRVGKVKDIWLDEFWNLVGIILDNQVWLGLRKVSKIVNWEDVVHYGEDALMIRNGTVLTTKNNKQLLRTFHTGVVRLKDMPVYTNEGLYLGKVVDVYFKTSMGTQIIGYELTDGFLADVFEGRRKLFLPEGTENVTLGEDSILVPASYERVLERPYVESDR